MWASHDITYMIDWKFIFLVFDLKLMFLDSFQFFQVNAEFLEVF